MPITGTVDRHVNDSFEDVASVGDLDLWSLHVPKWAPISIVLDSVTRTDKCLERRDENPYDQAVAERTFPVSGRVNVVFRILHERNSGLALGPVPVRGAAGVENW